MSAPIDIKIAEIVAESRAQTNITAVSFAAEEPKIVEPEEAMKEIASERKAAEEADKIAAGNKNGSAV